MSTLEQTLNNIDRRAKEGLKQLRFVMSEGGLNTNDNGLNAVLQ